MPNLTARQRAFLDRLFADPRRNATRAAEAAGYAWPGKQGPRLMTFPAVASAVRAETEAIRKAGDARRAADLRAWLNASDAKFAACRKRRRKRRRCM